MKASKVSVLYIYIKYLFFKYCADVKKCGSFKGLGFIYIYIYIKYCADVEKCGSFKGLGFIYIYIDWSCLKE